MGGWVRGGGGGEQFLNLLTTQDNLFLIFLSKYWPKRNKIKVLW